MANLQISREFSTTMMTSPWLKLLGSYYRGLQDLNEARKQNYNFCKKIIDHYKESNNPSEDTVIHKLMTNPHYSSDKERMDDMTILLFAGYDTTACTLSWAFLDLAKYPEEQDKLRNILNKLDPDERAVCRDLRYFLNESMRLNPVVPGGFRQTTRDFYVKSDKTGEEFFIPSGSTLQMNHYYMSRDEIYFPDPLTFNHS